MDDVRNSSPQTPTTEPAEIVLHSRQYLSLLLFAALLGIPVSLAAWLFLVAAHELENLVWDDLPEALGYDTLPIWWALATLGVAGLLVGLAVPRLPGRGGHVPAMGLSTGPTPPSALPGVVLMALASLVLGAVVGPEAPLIALGGGLAVLAASRVTDESATEARTVLAASGSAAAISAIFGNPVIAAIMFIEVMGLGRRKTLLVVLPCLVSSGIGAIVFTGLGNWSGLPIDALTIPNLDSAPLRVADVLWAIPIAIVVALGIWAVFVIGRTLARWASARTLAVTLAAGLAAGVLALLYAAATTHSANEVALSGQADLGTLAEHPGEWSTGALLLLLLCKGVAYGLCLGVFRGGPIFPAVFLGAAVGALAYAVLPGAGLVPSLAAGMGAGASVIGLPVTAVVLVVLLMGDAVHSQMPVLILSVVAAVILHEKLSPPDDEHADEHSGH